jgi:hypothetical protein
VLDPGQAADVDITFDNCSGDVWGPSHRINAAAPATDGRWGAGNLALPLDVGPGFRMTVPFRITAPRDAGAYAYRWVVTRAGEDGKGARTNLNPQRALIASAHTVKAGRTIGYHADKNINPPGRTFGIGERKYRFGKREAFLEGGQVNAAGFKHRAFTQIQLMQHQIALA